MFVTWAFSKGTSPSLMPRVVAIVAKEMERIFAAQDDEDDTRKEGKRNRDTPQTYVTVDGQT